LGMVNCTGEATRAGNDPAEIEAAVRRIWEGGYKATPQRLAVLEALNEEPLRSVEVLRRCCSGVGMVTVYRTLRLLVELGIARRVDLGEGARYELAANQRHRLVCEPCGKVFDFEEPAPGLQRYLLDALEQSKIEARLRWIEIYVRCRGQCAACS
jgi:Fur family ferric uptake transcriptional regulator